jgi:hypothetical protein
MVIETRTMFGGVDFFGDGGGGISETIGRHNVIDLRIKTISRGCTG